MTHGTWPTLRVMLSTRTLHAMLGFWSYTPLEPPDPMWASLKIGAPRKYLKMQKPSVPKGSPFLGNPHVVLGWAMSWEGAESH